MKQFTIVLRDVVRGGPRTLILGNVGPVMDGVAALTKGLRVALDNGYILLPERRRGSFTVTASR
ncbi:MAG: hypothetical protein WC565_03885 [Parcubacteria group bacterium]|jgi:hypothetical protein